MRISQLSERAGLPVGTVKFYLRSGLLPHGRATSATQAEYDETHLERLRLIRALLEVGGLSHAEIQRILDAISLPTDSVEDSLKLVRDACATQFEQDADVDVTEARALVESLGWAVPADSPHLPGLARALTAARSVGLKMTPERLRVYAEAASHVARSDVQTVADSDRPLTEAAAGQVLFGAILSSLRQLAVENHVVRRKSGIPSPRVSIPGA